jgi:hypothetical protein
MVAVSLIIVFSPIYLLRRKMWRMADDDLKRIDYNEWKKQIKSNAFIKLGGRIIWGLFLLSGFIINFRQIIALGFNLLTVFVFALGVSFIVWGILGIRWELRKLNEIK